MRAAREPNSKQRSDLPKHSEWSSALCPVRVTLTGIIQQRAVYGSIDDVYLTQK